MKDLIKKLDPFSKRFAKFLFRVFPDWKRYLSVKPFNEDSEAGYLAGALIAAAIFIGTQVLVSGGIGIIFAIGTEIRGWSENLIFSYSLPITIVVLLASIFANWLVLRPLNKTSGESLSQPPPPPTFESSEN